MDIANLAMQVVVVIGRITEEEKLLIIQEYVKGCEMVKITAEMLTENAKGKNNEY